MECYGVLWRHSRSFPLSLFPSLPLCLSRALADFTTLLYSPVLFSSWRTNLAYILGSTYLVVHSFPSSPSFKPLLSTAADHEWAVLTQ